jgi:hypothetical protein
LNILEKVLKALTKLKDPTFNDIYVLDCWQIEIEVSIHQWNRKSLKWIGGIIEELCKIDSNWSTSTIEK